MKKYLIHLRSHTILPSSYLPISLTVLAWILKMVRGLWNLIIRRTLPNQGSFPKDVCRHSHLLNKPFPKPIKRVFLFRPEEGHSFPPERNRMKTQIPTSTQKVDLGGSILGKKISTHKSEAPDKSLHLHLAKKARLTSRRSLTPKPSSLLDLQTTYHLT